MAVPETSQALSVLVFAHPREAQVWQHEVPYLDQHGHFDAGTATSALLAADKASLAAPAGVLWDGRYHPLLAGQRWELAGGLQIEFVHTPGHTPGGLSMALPGHLLTGDTLFPGGPGLTGWPLSDFTAIMASVRTLLSYPSTTAIHPGHGPGTTVAAERPHVESWARRGW
jgi:hydroxyacylglutathione hydrolase